MPDFTVNSDETASTAQSLLTDFGQLQDKLQEVRTKVTNLLNSGYRTPAAQAKFVPFFEQFCKGFEQTSNGLEGMAKYVKGVGDAFQQADESLGSSLG
jgi:WXG100 family type VII secretion target